MSCNAAARFTFLNMNQYTFFIKFIEHANYALNPQNIYKIEKEIINIYKL